GSTCAKYLPMSLSSAIRGSEDQFTKNPANLDIPTQMQGSYQRFALSVIFYSRDFRDRSKERDSW
ncbi:MAG: hypothetical protein LUQ71_11010, partial [Methanoregula sp.]|nr:hypothetical protein [Methanoregula sp.]